MKRVSTLKVSSIGNRPTRNRVEKKELIIELKSPAKTSVRQLITPVDFG
jgi:hypothetical protein